MLGSTGLRVSRLAFGAGPIPATMLSDDAGAQRALVRTALDEGINWIDTAAGYGDGRSEQRIGQALAELGRADEVHVATKVRLSSADLKDVRGSVLRSYEASLARLQLERVTLLQLHNSITRSRDDEPTSITPADILEPGGVAEAFEELQRDGVVQLLGLTGIGQAEALRSVVESGRFQTIQIPYNVLNPSAGTALSSVYPETNYGNVIDACARQGMGVFAIRVYAGGALLGHAPSSHTLRTKFFPLDLFQRDVARSQQLTHLLPPGLSLKEVAVRFALSHPAVSSAIIGFSEPEHIREAVTIMQAGPLPPDVLELLQDWQNHFR